MGRAMSRMTRAVLAFVVAGGLASMSVSSRGAFVSAFFFLFFGSIVAFAVWMLGARRRAGDNAFVEDDQKPMEIKCPGPFIDELGVQRYAGDVFDLENFPEPGACGRVHRFWREGITSFDDRP